MSSFLQENEDLPRALSDLVRFYRGEAKARLGELRSLKGSRRGLLFSGMGTSELTPLYIQWSVRKAGMSCATVDAGEWLHYGEHTAAAELVVLTSQSGESVELRRLVDEKLTGQPYVAITNAPESSLARGAALVLPLCGGSEQSITTKTFTNNLAVLRLLAAALIEPAGVARELDMLDRLAGLMPAVDQEAILRAARHLGSCHSLAFVGRGAACVSARQCGLTFMEGCRIPSCPYTGGAFNHGPMEAVDRGLGVVVFSPVDGTAGLAGGLAERASGRGASVVLVTEPGQSAVGGAACVPLPARPDGMEADVFPILAARSQNLLLHRLAGLRGIEAGVFRYGSKVTQIE